MDSLALVPQVLKCHLGGSMPGASTFLYIYFKSKVLKLPYMYLRNRVNGIKRPWDRWHWYRRYRNVQRQFDARCFPLLLYTYFKYKVLQSPYIQSRNRVDCIKRPWGRLGQNDHEVIMVHENMVIIILITTFQEIFRDHYLDHDFLGIHSVIIILITTF